MTINFNAFRLFTPVFLNSSSRRSLEYVRGSRQWKTIRKAVEKIWGVKIEYAKYQSTKVEK